MAVVVVAITAVVAASGCCRSRSSTVCPPSSQRALWRRHDVESIYFLFRQCCLLAVCVYACCFSNAVAIPLQIVRLRCLFLSIVCLWVLSLLWLCPLLPFRSDASRFEPTDRYLWASTTADRQRGVIWPSALSWDEWCLMYSTICSLRLYGSLACLWASICWRCVCVYWETCVCPARVSRTVKITCYCCRLVAAAVLTPITL